jgi:hypothetical protein
MSDEDVYADDVWGFIDDEEDEKAERNARDADEPDMLAGSVPEAADPPISDPDFDLADQLDTSDTGEPETPESAPDGEEPKSMSKADKFWENIPTPITFKEKLERLKAAAAKRFGNVSHEVADDILHVRIPCEIRLWLEAQVAMKKEAGLDTSMSGEIKLAIRLLQFASLPLWQVEEVMRVIGLLPTLDELQERERENAT